MRSDFYGLPYAAQQAIRSGEHAASRARRQAYTIHSLQKRVEELEAELAARPTEDAYLATCRALHWRTAQLRAHGVEPIPLESDAPHYPPEDFDWAAAEARG